MSAVANLQTLWFPTVAAKLAPGTKATNLAFGNNTIYDTTNPSNKMSFTAAAALLSAPIKGMGNYTLPAKTTYRVAGGKFVEVEVDMETADIRVVSYASGLDIGRVIFPKGAESQVRSGMYQGIGQTLWEDFWYDPATGVILNADFLNFKGPTIMESPDTAVATWDEYVDPVGPYGGKGIGEPCLCGFVSAMTNALSNALGGYVFTKIPIAREDVVAAIQWMNQNGVS